MWRVRHWASPAFTTSVQTAYRGDKPNREVNLPMVPSYAGFSIQSRPCGVSGQTSESGAWTLLPIWKHGFGEIGFMSK